MKKKPEVTDLTWSGLVVLLIAPIMSVVILAGLPFFLVGWTVYKITGWYSKQ